MPAFEHIFDRDEPLHLFIIARHTRTCTSAAESSWTNMLVVEPFAFAEAIAPQMPPAPPDQSLSGRRGFAQ